MQWCVFKLWLILSPVTEALVHVIMLAVKAKPQLHILQYPNASGSVQQYTAITFNFIIIIPTSWG